MGDPGLDIKCDLLILGAVGKVNAGVMNRSNICKTSFVLFGGLLLKYRVWSWMQHLKLM